MQYTTHYDYDEASRNHALTTSPLRMMSTPNKHPLLPQASPVLPATPTWNHTPKAAAPDFLAAHHRTPTTDFNSPPSKLGSSGIKPRELSKRRCRMKDAHVTPDRLLSPSLSRTLKARYCGSKAKLRTPRTLTRLMQQHRDKERHRHRGLNATIKDILKKIPGYDDTSSETKIVKLQRIINYICHLEEHIQSLCADLGLGLEFKNLFLSPHIPKQPEPKKLPVSQTTNTRIPSPPAAQTQTHRRDSGRRFWSFASLASELEGYSPESEQTVPTGTGPDEQSANTTTTAAERHNLKVSSPTVDSTTTENQPLENGYPHYAESDCPAPNPGMVQWDGGITARCWQNCEPAGTTHPRITAVWSLDGNAIPGVPDWDTTGGRGSARTPSKVEGQQDGEVGLYSHYNLTTPLVNGLDGYIQDAAASTDNDLESYASGSTSLVNGLECYANGNTMDNDDDSFRAGDAVPFDQILEMALPLHDASTPLPAINIDVSTEAVEDFLKPCDSSLGSELDSSQSAEGTTSRLFSEDDVYSIHSYAKTPPPKRNNGIAKLVYTPLSSTQVKLEEGCVYADARFQGQNIPTRAHPSPDGPPPNPGFISPMHSTSSGNLAFNNDIFDWSFSNGNNCNLPLDLTSKSPLTPGSGTMECLMSRSSVTSQSPLTSSLSSGQSRHTAENSFDFEDMQNLSSCLRSLGSVLQMEYSPVKTPREEGPLPIDQVLAERLQWQLTPIKPRKKTTPRNTPRKPRKMSVPSSQQAKKRKLHHHHHHQPRPKHHFSSRTSSLEALLSGTHDSDTEEEDDAASCKEARTDHRKTSWMNGFMMYSRLHRRRYIQENPGIHTSHISKMMGQDWRKLSGEAQKPYNEKAKQYRNHHAKKPDVADQPSPTCTG